MSGDKVEIGKFEVGQVQKTEDQSITELEIKSTRKNAPSIKGFYYQVGDDLTMVWGAPGAKRPNPGSEKDIEAARTLNLKPAKRK